MFFSANIISNLGKGSRSLRNVLLFLTVLSLALLLNGCGGGGGGGGTDQQQPPPPGSYTISGTISLNGAGLSGITVNVSGAAAASSTATNASGNYSFSGLPVGNYTITPTSADYTFDPASMPVTITSADQSGQNFTATANSGTIIITF